MKFRPAFALGILIAGLVGGTACHPERVAAPAVASVTVEAPASEPKPAVREELAEQLAKKRKGEANRKAKVRVRAKEALERGREQLREEKTGDAMQAFQQAVDLDRDSVDAWLRIAYVYEQEGDETRAMEAFDEVKRLWAL